MPELRAEIIDLIHRHIGTVTTSWSVGTFGAIAEFHLDAGESVERALSPMGGTLATTRGAMHIELPENIHVAPYETLRRDGERWSQGVNFCLPGDAAACAGRDRLTELGPDRDAVRKVDRPSILFDIGLGIGHMDACIRTDDSDLIAILRENEGASIWALESPALGAIMAHSPHRVFLSQAGRVEVFQDIPPDEDSAETPQGPHTHVLPRLLQLGQSHSAAIPVPTGHLPCLSMYPASPVSDELGAPKAFDTAAHGSFQELMEQFAEPGIVELKARTMAAVRAGEAPLEENLSRHEKTALRAALRQLRYLDGPSEALSAWRSVFDSAKDEDNEAPWHNP